MKQPAVLIAVSVALMLVIGFAPSAFSEDTAAKTPHACASTCAKFVDANKDGVCDSTAVHHQNGVCSPDCKHDGSCKDKCKHHVSKASSTAKTAVQLPAGCDPAKCVSMPNGCTAKQKAACSGHKK